MGWLQKHGNSILGNLVNGVKDWLKSVVTSKSPSEVRCALFTSIARDAGKRARKDLLHRRNYGERTGRFMWIEGGVKIEVINGYSYGQDGYTTEVIVTPCDVYGDHLRIVFDKDGNEIVNECHIK